MTVIQLLNKSIKAAVIQMNIVQGDIAYNLANAVKKTEEAAGNGADMICLPEAFATGVNFMQLHHIAQSVEDSEILNTMKELAKKLQVTIIFGMVEREGESKIYDSAFVVNDNGEIDGKYRRRVLWYGETSFVESSNEELECIETKFGKIGIIIGYEIFFPELCKKYYEENVVMIVCVANIFKSLAEKTAILPKARAVENQCYFLFTSSIGTHTLVSDTYMGRSAIICDKSLLPRRLVNLKEGDALVIAETKNMEDILYSKLYLNALRDSKDRYFLKDFQAYKMKQNKKDSFRRTNNEKLYEKSIYNVKSRLD